MASSPQIRITKTPELARVLEALQQKFVGLTEGEIVKLAISTLFRHEDHRDENGFTPKEARELDQAIADADRGVNIEGPFKTNEELFRFLDSDKK